MPEIITKMIRGLHRTLELAVGRKCMLKLEDETMRLTLEVKTLLNENETLKKKIIRMHMVEKVYFSYR